MDILKISGIAFVVITISAILKQTKPEFAIQVILISAVMILTAVLTYSRAIYDYLYELCGQTGINIQYIKVIFKIIVISYVTEFTASLCRDSGESAIAVKVETVGKLIIIASSLPVFKELISILSAMVI